MTTTSISILDVQGDGGAFALIEQTDGDHRGIAYFGAASVTLQHRQDGTGHHRRRVRRHHPMPLCGPCEIAAALGIDHEDVV
jgi:hypothetical protein